MRYRRWSRPSDPDANPDANPLLRVRVFALTQEGPECLTWRDTWVRPVCYGAVDTGFGLFGEATDQADARLLNAAAGEVRL
jgi:hypothetical protein